MSILRIKARLLYINTIINSFIHITKGYYGFLSFTFFKIEKEPPDPFLTSISILSRAQMTNLKHYMSRGCGFLTQSKQRTRIYYRINILRDDVL